MLFFGIGGGKGMKIPLTKAVECTHRCLLKQLNYAHLGIGKQYLGYRGTVTYLS